MNSFESFKPPFPVEHLADPREPLGKGGVLRLLFLVFPVRRDTEFGGAVHLEGAYLNFERLPEVGDDRRVQRLVHVRLGGGDVVFNAAGDGLPALVNFAEHLVALVHRVDDDAHSRQIVDLVERLVLRLHLFIDGIKMLGPTEHFAFDIALFEDVFDLLDDKIDEVVPLVQLLVDVFDEVLVRLRLEVFEAQVLQFALDLRNTQAPRERGVNVERFLRHLDLALFGKEVEGAHVVQAVGELDDDDADVLRHRHENFAEVLRFLLLARLKDDLIQFGDARNEQKHLVAEVAADVLLGDGSILDDVVQKGSRDRRAVQSQLDEDLRHGARVDEVRLARGALLPAVRLLGVAVGADEKLSVLARVIVVDHLQNGIHRFSFNAHTAL